MYHDVPNSSSQLHIYNSLPGYWPTTNQVSVQVREIIISVCLIEVVLLFTPGVINPKILNPKPLNPDHKPNSFEYALLQEWMYSAKHKLGSYACPYNPTLQRASNTPNPKLGTSENCGFRAGSI